jgi:hypothetical protein
MKKWPLLLMVLLIGLVIAYLTLPVINFGFFGFPFLLIVLTLWVILLLLEVQVASKTKQLKVLSKPKKGLMILLVSLIVYVTLVPLITGAKVFYHQQYRDLIGDVTDGKKITNHIAPISINEIRVVDEALAHLLGEKILGSQPALGSQVELGDFCIQKVNNKLYWVAPLLHSGFFKWMNNTAGTSGYVMVSATNERDVKLVQNIDGNSIKIKYQPAAFFQSDIHRHVYFNGYATAGLEDFSFEIDDKGNPFWIITKYAKKVGFSGNDAVGVLVVNAQSGEIQSYGLNAIPAWVDRVQPVAFIEEQLDNWGQYVHGYWNFSNSDKLQITEGLTLVYGKNNKSYWYTGLTSVGKDESAVGFVLVDTRTKETTFYKQGGATEFAAQSSAEGKVQEKGYSASMPIPYNINGLPTYVMTLKDDGGLVKMFAMVAISDYTIVGVGNTMREALMSYKNVYNMADNKINPGSQSNKKTVVSVISRIQNDVKSGNSFYYFTLKNHPNIFVGSSQLSSQLPISMVGDSVKVSFDVDLEEVIDVASFENLKLKQKSKQLK